jgi:hypothetical protein
LIVDPAFDQSGGFEFLQMIDYRLGTDVQILTDLGHVAGLLGKESEYSPPIVVSEQIQKFGGIHLPDVSSE